MLNHLTDCKKQHNMGNSTSACTSAQSSTPSSAPAAPNNRRPQQLQQQQHYGMGYGQSNNNNSNSNNVDNICQRIADLAREANVSKNAASSTNTSPAPVDFSAATTNDDDEADETLLHQINVTPVARNVCLRGIVDDLHVLFEIATSERPPAENTQMNSKSKKKERDPLNLCLGR
jgi:hypothetical protein